MKKIFLLASLIFSFSAHSYQLFRTGSMLDIETSVRPYYCLAGGGSDEAWEEGWKKLLEAINGGDVLIIREDKNRGGYEEWLMEMKESGTFPKFNSVSTLALDGIKDSFDLKVLDAVKKSEFIFFAGGFQNNYFDYIKNTPLQKIIQDKINNNKLVLAGTSAGMAIMSDLAFGAHYKSLTTKDGFLSSGDILSNPLRDEIDLIDGLFELPYLKNFVLDTHFARRNREGRLMGFMANGFFKYGMIYDGLGVDEHTALCFDLKGKAQVFGSDHVYLVKPINTPNLKSDHSLLWNDVSVKRLTSKDEINLKSLKTLYGKEVWSADRFIFESLWQ